MEGFGNILISYSYFEKAESQFNLKFFCQKGVTESPQITFIFGINGGKCSVNIPSLPNVLVHSRENKGYDYGCHGENLAFVRKNKKEIRFDHFIFMNDGVVGPFLPSYVAGLEDLHWSFWFLNRLNQRDVKLVGTSIVCLREKQHTGPRVEGFFFATDKEGLEILEGANIFSIRHKKEDVILQSEYMMSQVILEAGYNLDCLLSRYQGMNWRDTKTWHHNAYKHPSRHHSNDGISIHPLEVIFHKWNWSYAPHQRVSWPETLAHVRWSLVQNDPPCK